MFVMDAFVMDAFLMGAFLMGAFLMGGLGRWGSHVVGSGDCCGDGLLVGMAIGGDFVWGRHCGVVADGSLAGTGRIVFGGWGVVVLIGLASHRRTKWGGGGCALRTPNRGDPLL